jgi:hypothetical protein
VQVPALVLAPVRVQVLVLAPVQVQVPVLAQAVYTLVEQAQRQRSPSLRCPS